MIAMEYRIGQLARLARVTVRTLRYYDKIGLLRPSGRGANDYRYYVRADLERLQEILFFKALEFSLEEIERLVNAPQYERRQALLAQRAIIRQRAQHLKSIEASIDCAIAELDGDTLMNDGDMFGSLTLEQQERYEAEAKQRWGHTDSYRESMRRTAAYGPDDWRRYESEAAALNAAIAELVSAGVAPTDERALDLVERHRLQIDGWFYPCSRDMHARLGEMYVADERFRQNYERIAPGMAEFMAAATKANLARG
jgi:DNA-binding transcriptional MerR regulator